MNTNSNKNAVSWLAIFLASPLGRDLPRLWAGELSKRAQALHRGRLEAAEVLYVWIVRSSRLARQFRILANKALEAGKFRDSVSALRGEAKINDEIQKLLQSSPPERPAKASKAAQPQSLSVPVDLSKMSDAELKRIMAGGAPPVRRPPGRPPGYPASGAAKAAHERRLKLLGRQTEGPR